MNLIYVLNSLIWSAIGFVAGFVIARLGGGVNEIRKNTLMDVTAAQVAADNSAEGHAETQAARKRRMDLHHLTSQQIIGLAIVVMSLLSIGLVAITNYQLQQSTQQLNRVTACTARYNVDYTNALRARDVVAQQTRAQAREQAIAGKQLWLGFLANAPKAGEVASPAQHDASIAVLNHYLASVDAYAAALDESNKAAATYPLPGNTC